MKTKKFNLIPNGDRVVLKKIEVEEVLSSGIILYNQDQNKELYYGVVVAAGEGKRIDNTGPIQMFCKEGDVVMFKPQNGLEFPYYGETYFLLRDNEIAFIVNDK